VQPCASGNNRAHSNDDEPLPPFTRHLAEPILASLRQSGDGELSGRAVREGELDALCISVCLAKATELIRAEGSRHAGWWWGTQVDLSRIIRLLRGIVASLSVDIAAVSQLLVRFASYM